MTAKLRVKIKSLAAEARIIREEARRQKDKDIKNVLSDHRRGVVRSEARYAQLAYAYCRQVPYKVVEPTTREENKVEIHRLIKQVQRMDYRQKDDDIEKWFKS